MGKMHNQLMGVSCMDNPEIAATASPIKFVNEDFPPAYFLQGVQDRIIPYTQSVSMVRMINEKCGVGHAELKLFPNADHGAAEMKTDEEVDLILDFIDRHIWGGGASAYAPPEGGSAAVVSRHFDKYLSQI